MAKSLKKFADEYFGNNIRGKVEETGNRKKWHRKETVEGASGDSVFFSRAREGPGGYSRALSPRYNI